MKYFSFRIIIFSILLPPLLYILTVRTLEYYLTNLTQRKIENMYIGQTDPILAGKIRLIDAVNTNIDRYLKESRIVKWGLLVEVMVVSEEGKILYPADFESENPFKSVDQSLIAAENYKMMNQGLTLRTRVKVDHTTFLAACIFGFYMVMFTAGLYSQYRWASRKAGIDEFRQRREIDRLLKIEKSHSEKLKKLSRDRRELYYQIRAAEIQMEKNKHQASRFENEMFDEIVALEEKIAQSKKIQEQQQKENEALRERLERYENALERQVDHKNKTLNSHQRRFKTLYKNVNISKKALSGFTDLNEEMRLKCEELILMLNNTPENVPIKRKIFGKKIRINVFEVTFAYNGRLYFQNTKKGQVEVLAIGTKNSQARDLAYLESVK